MPAALEECCPKTSGILFSMKGDKYVHGRDIHIFCDQVLSKIPNSIQFLYFFLSVELLVRFFDQKKKKAIFGGLV